MTERVKLLGVPVDALTFDDALRSVSDMIESGSRGNYVLAVNPEKVMALAGEPELNEMFGSAALLVPDGIGVVLALRWMYGMRVERVAGADLMQSLCAHAAAKGYRIFVYGAREEVNACAVERLVERYPGLIVAGRSNGYVKDEDMESLRQKINEVRPDILFVALGSPKQEKWIQDNLPKLDVKVCQGIGGTLDTITGRVKRAPVYMQRLGLEWLYRLLREPSRIRRQAVLPVFAVRALIERIRG